MILLNSDTFKIGSKWILTLSVHFKILSPSCSETFRFQILTLLDSDTFRKASKIDSDTFRILYKRRSSKDIQTDTFYSIDAHVSIPVIMRMDPTTPAVDPATLALRTPNIVSSSSSLMVPKALAVSVRTKIRDLSRDWNSCNLSMALFFSLSQPFFATFITGFRHLLHLLFFAWNIWQQYLTS